MCLVCKLERKHIFKDDFRRYFIFKTNQQQNKKLARHISQVLKCIFRKIYCKPSDLTMSF